MKKYLYIYKSEIMSNLQYISNILVGFIGYIIMIFIFLNLWNYMYDNPDELINGYNKSQMIWYVIITEIIWSCVKGRKFCKKIIDDVRSGNIAYNINKPYSYIGYSIASHLGESTLRGILYLPMAIVLGIIFIGTIPALNILQIIVIMLIISLSVTISSLIIILIGLLSFVIEDANPVYWIYSKIVLMIGTIFPVEYFPAALQPIINISPIYVTSYGPAKLFVDFNWNTCKTVLIAQIIYIIITYTLCVLMYKKGVKKLNVNGG